MGFQQTNISDNFLNPRGHLARLSSCDVITRECASGSLTPPIQVHSQCFFFSFYPITHTSYSPDALNTLFIRLNPQKYTFEIINYNHLSYSSYSKYDCNYDNTITNNVQRIVVIVHTMLHCHFTNICIIVT